jgi:hypothetical protein
LLVEEFHRSVGSGAPGQGWEGVDDAPEAIFGAVQSVWVLDSILRGFDASDRLGAARACGAIRLLPGS